MLKGTFIDPTHLYWPTYQCQEMDDGSGILTYCQTSNISHTLVSNEIVDHSDAVGASPVGAAPTASSFAT